MPSPMIKDRICERCCGDMFLREMGCPVEYILEVLLIK